MGVATKAPRARDFDGVAAALLNELVKMHQMHGVVWMLGSGEAFHALYAGLVCLDDDDGEPWEEGRNWRRGNNVGDVLRDMVDDAQYCVSSVSVSILEEGEEVACGES